MKIAAVSVFALALSSAAQAQTTPIKMTPEAQKQFQEAMRNTLKDPYSAKYRNVVFARNKQTGDYTFCG